MSHSVLLRTVLLTVVFNYMSKSHLLARHNPLLPYFHSIPGERNHWIQYPLNLRSAKIFLSNLPSTSLRMRQCITCHRFITGASEPSVDHSEGASGPLCILTHHPDPCPMIDRHGIECHFHAQVAAALADPVNDLGGSGGQQQEVLLLQQQLEQIQKERDDDRKRAHQLQIANANLQDSHARLSQQVASHSFSSVPTTTTSTTSTTTSVSSVLSSSSAMGTGYSSSLLYPRTVSQLSATPLLPPSVSAPLIPGLVSSLPHPHVSGQNAGQFVVPPVLAGAASNHVLRNTAPTSSEPSLGVSGYTGPTIPEMRGDVGLNALTQHVMSILLREVPSLAPPPSAPLPSAPPPFTPTPALSSASTPVYPPPPAASVYQHLSSSQPLLGGSFLQQPDPRDSRLDSLQRELDQLRNQPGSQDQVPLHVSRQLPVSHQSDDSLSLDSLVSKTVKCKQYKALDFTKLGTFPYLSQVKESNINLALFSYGSLRHILCLIDGTLTPVSHGEICSRLQHLVNVLEIVCLSSSLSDFDNNAWKIGKFYNSRIINDIEIGIKRWEGLDKAIDPTAWQFAKELLVKSKPPQNQTKNPVNNSNVRICTTYNTFRKDGCSYEHNNPGETCVFLHVCNKCRKKHKAWQCTEDKSQNSNSSTASLPSSGSGTPVTSV